MRVEFEERRWQGYVRWRRWHESREGCEMRMREFWVEAESVGRRWRYLGGECLVRKEDSGAGRRVQRKVGRVELQAGFEERKDGRWGKALNGIRWRVGVGSKVEPE